MLPIKRLIIKNLLLAATYFAGSCFGIILAIWPNYASPLWPGSGIALAALLLYGRRILPGIFIGALSAQLFAFIDASDPASFKTSLIIGCVASIGSCLQALTGAWLIKHFVGSNDPLIEERKIIFFLMLGGPVSCIIAPTAGITALYFTDSISTGNYLIAWGTWWVGDSIGVLILAPLMLIILAPPKQVWAARRQYVARLLGIMLVLIFALLNYGKQHETQRLSQIFGQQTARFHTTLKAEIDHHLEDNQMLKALFDSSEHVTAAEFKTFTQPIIKRLQSVQALEWIPRVTADQRKHFESTQPGHLLITEKASDGTLRPAQPRPEYFPITYIEPYHSNERASGFDIGSNPKVLMTLKNARDSGATRITGKIQLIQDERRKTGIVIYTPVYKTKLTVDNAALRAKFLQGFIACVLILENEIDKTLEQLPAMQLQIQIRDGADVIYSNTDNNNDPPVRNLTLQNHSSIRLGDHLWRLDYQASPDFFDRHLSWSIWWLLFACLTVVSLFSLGLLILTGKAAHVEALVKAKTRTLELTNQHLNNEIAVNVRLQHEQDGRNKVLELLATGKSLSSILNEIIAGAEYLFPEALCAIFLLDQDKQCLRLGAAPSLPEIYTQHLDSIIIDNYLNCCGSVAFSGKRLIVDNLLNHPFWQQHPDLLKESGLTTCWSEPVKSTSGQVIGVFAMHFREPRSPKQQELDFITRKANLTSIAIEKKRDENELRIAATTFHSHEAILITDADENILRVNQAFTDITGFSAEEAIGKTPRIMSSGRHDKAFFRDMYDTLEKQGQWKNEIWNRRKNGDVYPEWLTITVVHNAEDQLTHYVAIFSDITEQKTAELEIQQLAFYDPLTGLPNRRLLLDRLEQEMTAAKRRNNFGALIFLDLDRFKIINDSQGHHIGDELLVQVSRRMKNTLRNEDTACRLGGDEFVILTPGKEINLHQTTDRAALIAEKIRLVLSEPYLLKGNEYFTSCSIGITIYPENTDQSLAVLQQADTAMYRSKMSGGNRIHFFRPSMQEEANKRLQMEKEMRIAITERQFVLYYQPQFDVNHNMISMEALIRWQHPEKGMISPAEFIPVAEETQMILPIGFWVLREVCQQLKVCNSNNFHLNHIAVNVSSRQFRQADFIKQVQLALQETGVAAEKLMLELTEGVVIDDIADTKEKMHALNELGVSIAIDDFGTGYSSLSYLKQLPFNELKIDQSFVRDITIDPNDAVIVETIINMAHSLGLDVVAEGVETEAQLKFLIQKGCTKFQGYYFARPAPAETTFIDGRKPSL